MSYSDQITSLIDALKLEPNSEERNKLISKLKDAWAWAKVLDWKYKEVPNEPSDCTCAPSYTAKDCPVHGKEHEQLL